MRLLSIEISNFRQFNGVHSMDLDVKPGQNVVVIHGENGAGKTTLLNAFKWCFYGQTDFDTKSENLLNEKVLAEAVRGDKLTMHVKVDFEHDGMRHTARREAVFRKGDDLRYDAASEPFFSLTWIDASGGFNDSKNAPAHMSQILPDKMQPYFFFNGERIEKLAHVNAAQQVQSAIKNLMGLEIVERASQHVSGPVIAKLRKELKESSPKDLAEAMEREAAISEQIEDTKLKVATIENNITHSKDALQDVNKKLGSNAEVAALNSERLSLESQAELLKTQLANLRKERRDFISTQGGLAFAEGLLGAAGAILEDKRKKGELPFKVKEQFINDLLSEHRCICERELAEGTPPYHAVSAFKSSTTSVDVENAFIETSGTIVQMVLARTALFERLTAFQAEEHRYSELREQHIGRIDVIGKQILELTGGREVEEIVDLETKRGKLTEDIERFSAEKGALEKTLKDMDDERIKLKKERERLSHLHQKNGLATSRLKLAEEVKRVLDDFYTALAEQVRDKLSAKVDATFKAIMRKPYWAEISKDYTLQIYKEVGDNKQLVYEKSTGENQITSLSFVGSIVSIAKERSRTDNENFRGGVFPIVMDSPFGALDPDYRSKIAAYIPELAEQVIIMVSESQWKGEVELQVKPRMARAYTLHYFTPGDAGSGGKSGSGAEDKFEHTKILEASYGE